MKHELAQRFFSKKTYNLVFYAEFFGESNLVRIRMKF